MDCHENKGSPGKMESSLPARPQEEGWPVKKVEKDQLERSAQNPEHGW